MANFDNHVYQYIQVSGDSLKEINDNTREIWENALNSNYDDIIDITREDDKYKSYLVDPTVYYNLIQASRDGANIDPYGIPNVNFSLIRRGDRRWNEYYKQRMERGFDDSELWSLDSTIVGFILPRLKAFSENIISIPSGLTEEEWSDIINQMIEGFEYYQDDEYKKPDNMPFSTYNDLRQEKINNGLNQFVKYLGDLWN